MADSSFLRRFVSRLSPSYAGVKKSWALASIERRCPYGGSISVEKGLFSDEENNTKKDDKWYTLPPFTSAVDGDVLGKTLARKTTPKASAAVPTVTVLKWVLRCCPELPRSLVQKLFRLRQVRRGSCNVQSQQRQLKRVSAKDLMNPGDRIFLPVTVEKELPSAKAEYTFNKEEFKFLHSLILYKDPAIIVVNKPHGMPVQGGIGIKRSFDELAAQYLRFNDSEFPRLVHRLDRDCSGILVMGRSTLSAAALHSIFREKTSEASEHDLGSSKIIQKTYWALVIGSPRCPKGLISKPLGKVLIDSGKSDRIKVIDNIQSSLAQCAVTEYKVIGLSCHGYTWLELSPLTGRKHQLRVHCAEVLGTPIVGDYKYGRLAHRKMKSLCSSTLKRDDIEEQPKAKLDPFGLDIRDGSIMDKQPRLHLHCKEMVLPDFSLAMQHAESLKDFDLAAVKCIKLNAPLPSHMQRSWDFLNS